MPILITTAAPSGRRSAVVRIAGPSTSKTAIVRLACSVARTGVKTMLSHSDVTFLFTSRLSSG